MLHRRTIAMFALFVALGLCASTMFTKEVYGRYIGLFEFLARTVRLCDGDLQALKAGEAVATEVPSSPKNELSLFGAVRVDKPLHAYLAETRNPLFFETEMVQAWGQFSDPPGEQDLKDLTWPEQDLEALPECRTGNCKIKLPPGYLDQLQPWIGDKTLFADRANALLRRSLIDYLNRYRDYGNAALMEYTDKRQQVSIAEEFAGILENFSPLNLYTPDLQTYLKDYPSNRPANAQSRFIWAKVLLGGQAKRPIIFLYHLITYQTPGSDDTAVVLKQIYASHYYEAALGLTLMVADPENSSRFYLLHFDRERIDVLRNIPAFLCYGFRGDTRIILTRRLEAIREETKRRTW
jgi:hypothetical protein